MSINPNDLERDVRWIMPLACFTAKLLSGARIEIPAHIRKPLGIRVGDIIELAIAGGDTEIVSATYGTIGVRTRVSVKEYILRQADVSTGDTVTVAILSVFRDRSEGLLVLFDTEQPPKWNTEIE